MTTPASDEQVAGYRALGVVVGPGWSDEVVRSLIARIEQEREEKKADELAYQQVCETVKAQNKATADLHRQYGERIAALEQQAAKVLGCIETHADHVDMSGYANSQFTHYITGPFKHHRGDTDCPICAALQRAAQEDSHE